MAYDALSRLDTTTYYDAQGNADFTAENTYDLGSRVTDFAITGSVSSSAAYTYDDLDRVTGLVTEGPAGTATVSTSYDDADLPLSTSYTVFEGAARTIVNDYAKTNELKSATWQNLAWFYGYGSDGLTNVRTTASAQSVTYDTFGRLSAVTGSTSVSGAYAKLFSSSLSYDGLSRIDETALSGVKRVEDSASSVSYTGTWYASNGASQSGLDYHYSSAANSTAAFSTYSPTVTIIGMKGPAYGKCDILVDGEKQGATIDCYQSGTASYQVPIATLTGLDPTTPHTVTVKVLGTKNAASSGTTIIFDAFETRQLASFTDSYAYDLASRVTSWTRAGEGATSVTYGYDAAGNLDTLTRDSVTTAFTHDADNRLTLAVTGSSVTTYTNDLYGRRTAEITSEDPSATAVATTYTWDAMGHLTGVSLDDGATVCSYSYGATGMRESASVTEGSTTSTTKSFWLGFALTAEIDSVGDETGTRYDYLWRPDGTPLALAVTSGGATSVFHYQTDAFGSVIAITDSSGLLVASYTYGAYGDVLTATGYGANAALAERNPLRYRGYYYDTATGLYYLPVRYYDPGTCRFLSADPAGPSAGDPLTLNAYAYCVGDPVNLEDPSGAVPDYVFECPDGVGAGLHVWNEIKKGSSAQQALNNYNVSSGSGFATISAAPSQLSMAPATPDTSPYGMCNNNLLLSEPDLGTVLWSGVQSLLNAALLGKAPTSKVPAFDRWSGQQWWVAESASAVGESVANLGLPGGYYDTYAKWEAGYATKGDVEQARLCSIPVLGGGCTIGTTLFYGYAPLFGYEYAEPMDTD